MQQIQFLATGKQKHPLSPKGRARIPAAQKARWARLEMPGLKLPMMLRR